MAGMDFSVYPTQPSFINRGPERVSDEHKITQLGLEVRPGDAFQHKRLKVSRKLKRLCK